MLVGYARVSTQEQDHALQLDALQGGRLRARSSTEKASGAQRERPELKAALDYMREGDTLVVWKLDRLARSLKQLIETVEELGARKASACARSPRRSTPPPPAAGWCSTSSRRSPSSSARSSASAPLAGLQAARARGRKGGRPPASPAKDLAAAKAMLRDPGDHRRARWRGGCGWALDALPPPAGRPGRAGRGGGRLVTPPVTDHPFGSRHLFIARRGTGTAFCIGLPHAVI